MSGFTHPVATGGGALILPSLHSPDYVPGSTGWAIFKNGNVEFNSGVFRGTVTAGVFEGADFIINQTGMFFYSSTPAFGNLIFSVANASGVDGFGNAYNGPGPWNYASNGQSIGISSSFDGFTGLFMPSGQAMESIASSVVLQIVRPGASQLLVTNVQGPSDTARGDYVLVGYASSAKDGSQFAGAFHEYHTVTGGVDTSYECIILNNTGVYMPFVNTLTAQQPGNTVPTSETWHTMAPLDSGFNLTTSGNYAVYQLNPDGKVSIQVYATVTAGSGLTFKQLTTNALGTGLASPSSYHPVTPKFAAMTANELAVFTGSNNAGGIVQLTAAGQLFVYGVATGATSLYISADLPLNF